MKRIISNDHRPALYRAQVEDPPAGETSLHAFMRLFWPLVEPHRFRDGWHLHAKCEVLQEVSRRERRQVIINEPPGSCKSLLVNVFWPAWHWLTVDPTEAMLFGAYDVSNVNRDASKFLDLLRSPLVRQAWPEFRIGPDKEKKAIEEFTNEHKGLRVGRSTGMNVTGKHFGLHVYDDLINPYQIIEDAPGDQQKALQNAYRWVTKIAASRVNPVLSDRIVKVMIMQRLHEDDPAGLMLKEGGWDHLCFPEEYEPNASWIVGDLSARFDRRQPGELLWPEVRGRARVEQLKKELQHAGTAAQLQQNPSPTTGGLIEKGQLGRFHEWPDLSRAQIIQSWDLTFKSEKTEHSRVAWQLWARIGEYDYLLGAGADWLDYAQTKAKMRELSKHERWSLARAWLVEEKANGPALVSDLKDEFRQLVLFEPGSSNKLERMGPHLDRVRTGFVLFPHESIAPWVTEVIEEICKFPRASRDDHWDCVTQALAYLQTGKLNFAAARRNWLASRGKRRASIWD